MIQRYQSAMTPLRVRSGLAPRITSLRFGENPLGTIAREEEKPVKTGGLGGLVLSGFLVTLLFAAIMPSLRTTPRFISPIPEEEARHLLKVETEKDGQLFIFDNKTPVKDTVPDVTGEILDLRQARIKLDLGKIKKASVVYVTQGQRISSDTPRMTLGYSLVLTNDAELYLPHTGGDGKAEDAFLADLQKQVSVGGTYPSNLIYAPRKR